MRSHFVHCFLFGLAVWMPGPAHARQAADTSTAGSSTSPDAVDALRQRWTAGSGTAVVHVSNLHGTTRPMGHPIDNLVVGGVVQPRPFVGMLRGADQLVQAGQRVRVVSLEAVEGRKNDLLRFTVVTPGNAVTPIAFVVPAGGLRTMSRQQMEGLVLPVLTPVDAPAGTPADLAQRAGPVAAREAAPAASTWVIRQTRAGAEALLRGTAEGNHRTSPALLVLGCHTYTDQAGHPAKKPSFELRVQKSVFAMDVQDVGEKDGDDNGEGHVQIGTSPEMQVDLADWTVVPDTGGVAPLDLDLTLSELNQVLTTSDSPLRLGVYPLGQPEAGVQARFTLPAEGTPVQAALASCIESAKTTEAALHASRAVECPAVPDLVLLKGDVRRVATGKPLPTDPEHDQGIGWNLPKPTKARPIAPKVQLVCSYGHPGPHPETQVNESVVRLPIPSSASYCKFFSRTVQSRSSAYCH